MTANIIERQSQIQYEKYTIDTDRLTQRFQQKNMEQSTANEKSRRDTVDISEDARKALEELRKQDNIEIAGTVESDRLCMELKVYEDYEKAVMAETREKVTSGNFDRHVDKMMSAYQKMKNAIEEKYTDADEDKNKQLELLDKAYENHSKLMAGFTETMYDLRDFTSQITYYSNKNAIDQQVQTKPEKPVFTDKWKKGEIWNQAYSAFLSSIDKSGAVSQERTELNRIWDYYTGLR